MKGNYLSHKRFQLENSFCEASPAVESGAVDSFCLVFS